MGQRQRSLLFVVAVVGLVSSSSRPASGQTAVEPSGPPPAADEQAPYPAPFALGVTGGYAFRPDGDGRNHGGAAQVFGDVPLWWGFGLRLEGGLLAFGPSVEVERSLALPLASSSLIYAFDDADAVAVVGVGAFVGSPLELGDEGGSAPAVLAGGVASLELRFPLLERVHAVAAIRVPVVLLNTVPVDEEQAGGLPLYTVLTAGLLLSL